MRHLILSLAFATSGLFAVAQFGTAPDFNVTDIDGNQHQLYADILDQGLIAVIDVSATWCNPCWSLYTSNALEELHEAYGPDAPTSCVIFYEEIPTQMTPRSWVQATPWVIGPDTPTQSLTKVL